MGSAKLEVERAPLVLSNKTVQLNTRSSPFRRLCLKALTPVLRPKQSVQPRRKGFQLHPGAFASDFTRGVEILRKIGFAGSRSAQFPPYTPYNNIPILRMVKFYAPAQQARPGPPLSPVLGQHQIKVAEFVTDFNARTAHYVEGLPLGCRIRKMGSRWSLVVRPPTSALLLTGPTDPVRLWSILEFQFGPGFTPGQTRLLLGSARSGKVRLDE